MPDNIIYIFSYVLNGLQNSPFPFGKFLPIENSPSAKTPSVDFFSYPLKVLQKSFLSREILFPMKNFRYENCPLPLEKIIPTKNSPPTENSPH